MEVFRVSEVLLRCPQTVHRTAHRTASASQATAVARHCRSRQWQCQASRPFTTSRSRYQASGDSDAQQFRSSRQPSRVTDDVSSLLDSALDYNKGTPTAPATRTSRFKSSAAQPFNSPSRLAASTPYAREGRSSVDELLEGMKGRRQVPQNRTSSSDISLMIDPNNSTRPGPPMPPAPARALPIRLGPSAGRTVAVNDARGMDVGRAFRALEMQCSRNSVRRDFMRQRFHERPGLKRKRLKGERWRRRFKEGFRGVVKLVQKMKKQGW